MRNAGAARRRREPEPEPPDPVAEAVAALGRLSAETGKLISRMNRRDGEIAASAATIAAMPADAGQLAAQGEKITARQALQVIETISLAAHWAEAREVLERVEPQLGTIAMMRDAWIAEGRRREAAERDAQPRAPRGRHAARSRHLKVAGGIAAGSAVAASLALPAVIASQDSAAVHHWSLGRVSVRLHAGPADSAVLVPSRSPRAYVPRHAKPSADAASASPAPTPSLPAPSAPPSPVSSSQPPAPDVPVLSVARFLDLGDSIRGELTLTAGPDAVTWTATTTDGITLSQSGGVLVPRQAVTLEVTDAPAGGGWVRISAGTETFTVHVTSGLGPVLS